MFNFKLTLLNMLFKFNVVSDLPGRIRFKVNNYKKIPKEVLLYQNYAIEALKKLDGISNVNFNFVIGTILIEYDTKKLTSSDIINWLNEIKSLVAKNIDYINSISDEPEDVIKDKLFILLDDYIKNKDRR